MTMPAPEELVRITTAALAGFRRQIPRPVMDELRQETLTRTFGAPRVENPVPFVWAVARRLAIDWLRRRKEIAWELRPDLLEDPSWQQWIEVRLDAVRVAAALAEAPAHYRELIEALYFDEVALEDLVNDQLGDSGGGPEGRIRMRDVLYKRRRRALAWLRGRIGTRS